MATVVAERKRKKAHATSQREVAAEFSVSVETVQTWLSAGCPGSVGSPGKNGKYDLAKIRAWCKQNGKGEYSVKQQSQNGTDKSEAELRREKLAAEVEWKNIQNAKKRGELVEKSEVLSKVQTMFSNVRSRLEALPHEAANSAGIPPEHKLDAISAWAHLVSLTLRELEDMADG